MGERLLGKLHQPYAGRATEQGGVCRSEGGEGTGQRLPRSLQPREAARGVRLLDPYGVCGHRSFVAAGAQCDRGVRIGTQTLIMTGTDNGIHSSETVLTVYGVLENSASGIGHSRKMSGKGLLSLTDSFLSQTNKNGLLVTS